MKSIFDQIQYNGEKYFTLCPAKRKQALEVIRKLMPLYEDIVNYREGRINILDNGETVVTGFNIRLTSNIHALLPREFVCHLHDLE
jgi:hypothetical protein